MECNKSYLNLSDSDKYIEILKKKSENFNEDIDVNIKTNTNLNDNFNNNKTKLFDTITYLQEKINELNNKIEFCKRYQDTFYNTTNIDITDTIDMIEQIIISLDKSIIEKAQIKKNTKKNLIEIEFL